MHSIDQKQMNEWDPGSGIRITHDTKNPIPTPKFQRQCKGCPFAKKPTDPLVGKVSLTY